MVWERYCNASPKPEVFFICFVYIFIHISANMSPFGLEFLQMILHTETSKLMYSWSFLFVVLHKPTLLPSTFNYEAHLKNTKGCLCLRGVNAVIVKSQKVNFQTSQKLLIEHLHERQPIQDIQWIFI